MKTHLTNECPNRNAKCIHCKEIGTWVFINGNHFEVCPDLFLPCSNTGCGEKVKRRNLNTHQEICPKRVVPCPYVNMGCTLTFNNEDIAKHKQEHVEKHLSLAVKKVQHVEKDLLLAVKKVLHVEKDLSLAVKKIADVEKHVSLATEKVKHVEKDLSLAVEKIERLEIQQQTAPLVLKIEKFDGLTPVRSQPFYTSKGGYKMSLLVKPNGLPEYGTRWVSCSIDLMPGEYDDTLESFRGKVTVELLNQLEDNNHIQHTINYPQTWGYEARQHTLQRARYQHTKYGKIAQYGKIAEISKFISHNDLGLQRNVVQFLVNRTLYIRVNVFEHSQTKAWLVVDTDY